MNQEYFNYIKLVKLVTSIYEAATAHIAKNEMEKKKNIHHLTSTLNLDWAREGHISWLHNMSLGIRCGFVRLVIIK